MEMAVNTSCQAQTVSYIIYKYALRVHGKDRCCVLLRFTPFKTLAPDLTWLTDWLLTVRFNQKYLDFVSVRQRTLWISVFYYSFRWVKMINFLLDIITQLIIFPYHVTSMFIFNTVTNIWIILYEINTRC